MALVCHFGFHAWEITATRFDMLVRVLPELDTHDDKRDGQEERWRPLQKCRWCGVLRALDWDLGD